MVKFKSLLIKDQEQRLKNNSIDCEITNISGIKDIENSCALYPTVGENLDYLNSNNIKIDFLFVAERIVENILLYVGDFFLRSIITSNISPSVT